MNDFEWIKQNYNVPAEMFREVIVGGKPGVITADFGNYIGVVFYGSKKPSPVRCHPTHEVKYLDTFNRNPPKLTRSQERYRKFLDADCGRSFAEWLGIPKH